jgi:hypothetical protein
MERGQPMAPHSLSDQRRHLEAAGQIIAGRHAKLPTRQAMYRDVCCVLALTYGAGCEAKTVRRVQEKWLKCCADGLWLHRPDRAVPIPIGEPWAAMLIDALTGRPDALMVRPDNTGTRNEQVGKVMFNARRAAPGLNGFDSDRAAKTWLLQRLESAGFAHIVAMTGLKSGSQMLGDLSRYLATPEVADTMRVLQGWSR